MKSGETKEPQEASVVERLRIQRQEIRETALQIADLQRRLEDLQRCRRDLEQGLRSLEVEKVQSARLTITSATGQSVMFRRAGEQESEGSGRARFTAFLGPRISRQVGAHRISGFLMFSTDEGFRWNPVFNHEKAKQSGWIISSIALISLGSMSIEISSRYSRMGGAPRHFLTLKRGFAGRVEVDFIGSDGEQKSETFSIPGTDERELTERGLDHIIARNSAFIGAPMTSCHIER